LSYYLSKKKANGFLQQITEGNREDLGSGQSESFFDEAEESGNCGCRVASIPRERVC
jgi:hypothetical protein